MKPSNQAQPRQDHDAPLQGKVSLLRLVFPPNTVTVVFAHILLIGAGVSWLAGVFFLQPNGITVDQVKVLMIGAVLQIALLSFFFVKMLRFSKRFRYLPAYAAGFYALLHAGLAVKALLSGASGEVWYLIWALVAALSGWLFYSSRVDQLLKSNAIRYKLLHGRDPYEELADQNARKTMKAQKKGR